MPEDLIAEEDGLRIWKADTDSETGFMVEVVTLAPTGWAFSVEDAPEIRGHRVYIHRQKES